VHDRIEAGSLSTNLGRMRFISGARLIPIDTIRIRNRITRIRLIRMVTPSRTTRISTTLTGTRSRMSSTGTPTLRDTGTPMTRTSQAINAIDSDWEFGCGNEVPSRRGQPRRGVGPQLSPFSNIEREKL
jgi:hypothetical protein